MVFNLVDLIVFLAVLYFVWKGYTNGFLSGILNLVSTVLATFGAVIFYPQVSSFINTQFSLGQNLANIFGFFGLLLLTEFIFSLIVSFIYRFIFQHFLRFGLFRLLDSILGIVPSTLLGSFFLLLFLLLPVILPFDIGIRGPIQKSWVGQNVLPRAYLLEPELERLLKRIPTQSLLFVITPAPTSKETTKLSFPVEIKLVESPVDEGKMFELLNKERIEAGLKPLEWDPEIVPVARAHSRDMFVRSYFSHYNPEGESAFERMDKAGLKFLAAGENLAYAPTVEIAHQGLMNSPGHRDNILRKEFGRVGIGVIDGGIFGKMFTQNFAD